MGSQMFTKEQLHMVEGMHKAKALNPSDLPLSSSDTLICSSPKSGTTWLKSLAFTITTRTRFDIFSSNHPILSSFSHHLIPFIEVEIALHNTPRDPDLPLLSTHLPFSVLPDPVIDSGCKLVYICRNPKDVFVSYWHFIGKHKAAVTTTDNMSLEKAFDRFCSDEGAGVYGNYWDHVLGYWKASLDYPERFMFLKYEDMMGDAVPNVERLAELMGYPFSDEEAGSGAVARIVEMCSFGSMSKLEVNKTGMYRDAFSNVSYFRKAKVGDWTNYLTSEMANRIDQITIDKLADSGLTL